MSVGLQRRPILGRRGVFDFSILYFPISFSTVLKFKFGKWPLHHSFHINHVLNYTVVKAIPKITVVI